ncbi:sensor histidine kinase [Candidatus Methylacidiphilum infernorum]|uniref:histidine kinase n=1 Tax=Methylacidiphilum infernorum (isolate V4) TaxID=481448 RepID=B3DXI1_METI4|nr:ATP-binding protein [Candidatus Methylacidiphilum infernorum]ACD82215.1 Phosphate regulon sensor protein phoR [Methylacidiphilum infernorum V4]
MLWLLTGLVIFLCVGFLALFFHKQKFWLSRLHKIEKITDAIKNKRIPPSFLLTGDPLLSAISRNLEAISTELQRLIHASKEEEINLNTILKSMAEGIAIIDRSHLIKIANESFTRILGLSGNPQGKKLVELIQLPEVEKMIEEAFKAQEPLSQEILGTETKGKLSGYFVVDAVPVITKSQDLPSDIMVLVFRDITEIKMFEEARKEFVINVSHELRTPLAIFKGYVETLTDNPRLSKSEVKRIYEILKKHCQRLSSLIEDLLLLAKLESRKLTIETTPVSIAEFLEETIQDLHPLFKQKECTVNLLIEPDLPTVEIDPFWFQQAVYNLVDNALKFSIPPRKLVIEAQKIDQNFVLKIIDNGFGIPSKDLPFIFDRFYRGDKSRSSEQKGTGLGLSITKQIVELHGGQIRAISEPEKGTTMELTFPLQRENGLKEPMEKS